MSSEEAEVKIGTRVRVVGTDMSDLGLGTYEGVVGLDDDGNEVAIPSNPGLFDSAPKITLDTGRVIYGFECWWTPTNDALEVVVAEVERIGQPLN